MSLRTVRLIGKAYSDDGSDITLSCLVNGQETHGLTIPTNVGPMPDFSPDNPPEEEILMTFGVDHTEFVAGVLPVSITPTGGDILFVRFDMNHMEVSRTHDTENDTYTVDEDPINVYSDVNTNSLASDGKNNVYVDGVEQVRNATAELIGDWHYRVDDGQTLTCDYVVEDVKYYQLQNFVGDGTTDVFTLANPVDAIHWCLVDGARSNGTYSYNNITKQITFGTAPGNGDTIEIVTSADSTTE
jgi:hypothetical protein